MRKPILFLAVLFCIAVLTAQVRIPGPGGSSAVVASFTPTMIDWTSNSSTTTNLTAATVNHCPTSAYCLQMPNAALAANTWIGMVGFNNNPASVPTVTNDKSDTCAVVGPANDTTNGRRVYLWYCKNLTVGARAVTVTFSANVDHVVVNGAEFNNLDPTAPLDTSTTNTSASGSSTVTAGSFSPAGANEFLVQVGFRTQTPKSSSCGVGSSNCFTAGSGQAGMTWTMYTSDTIDGHVMQAGVYTLGSAINPQFTMSSNSGYASVAAFFKTASSGSARPATMRIVGVQHENEASGSATNHWQVRTEGNLLVSSNGYGGTNYTTTGNTDSSSCSWVNTGTQLGQSNSGKSMIWYCPNSSASAVKLIDNAASGTAADYTAILYDIQNAAASPYRQRGYFEDQTATITGATLPIWQPSVPGISDGIAIGNVQEAQNTSEALSAGCLTDTTTFGGETISGGGTFPPDENNGWWHCDLANNNQFDTTITMGANQLISAIAAQTAYFLSATGSINHTLGSDTFTKANGTLGPTTAGNGTWGFPQFGNSQFTVTSNAAGPASLSLDGGSLYTAGTFPANQWAQVTISALTGGAAGTDKGIGVMLRYSLAANTGYRIIVNNAVGVNTFVERMSAGSVAATPCTATANPAWAANDVLYAEVQGTTFKVFRGGPGGTQITGACTDATIATGVAGVNYSSTMTTAAVKNFSAGDF